MATEQSVLAIIRASRPNFKNPCDKIAFAIHSIFLASGFNLHATGPPAFTDHALSAPFPEEASIDGWNEVEDNYTFVYSSPGKVSKKVLVKCLVMNNQLFVDALAAGSSDPVHLEIKIDDFVGESGDTKYSSQFKNLGKLVDCVRKDVVTKLTGSSNTSTSSSTTSSEPKVQDNDNQPRSGSFGLEDTRAPYHPSGVVMPPVYPSIGSDVFPQPPAGTYPTRDGFGDGGMLVGPKDPRFLGGGVGGPMGFQEDSQVFHQVLALILLVHQMFLALSLIGLPGTHAGHLVEPIQISSTLGVDQISYEKQATTSICSRF